MRSFIVFAVLTIGMMVSAQDKTRSMLSSQPYEKIEFTQTYEGSFEYRIYVNPAEPYQYEINIKVDSTGNGNDFKLYHRAKLWESDSWTALDTITWAQTSSDTNIKISGSSDVKYRYQDIYILDSVDIDPDYIEFLKLYTP